MSASIAKTTDRCGAHFTDTERQSTVMEVAVARSRRLFNEYLFPRPALSARCRSGQETFAGVRGNGRDAPSAVIPALALERGSSTPSGRSLQATAIRRNAPQETFTTGPKTGRLVCRYSGGGKALVT